jgi:hypothetical protein
LPLDMAIAWTAGWFITLFVRIEDLNVMTPMNYQALCWFVGSVLIGASVIMAGVLLIPYR